MTPRRPHQRYCSDRCRWAAFDARRQGRLDFAPATQPVPVPVDPNLRKSKRPRLTAANLLAWERLKLGPATDAELSRIGCGKRPAARIHDLRCWIEEQGIPARIPTGEEQKDGSCLYRLECA
jgi:hypothetical protein